MDVQVKDQFCGHAGRRSVLLRIMAVQVKGHCCGCYGCQVKD